MSLSTIRYQSALRRFNTQSLSSPMSSNETTGESSTQKVSYKGYNPNTDKMVFENVKGETVEAKSNIQGKVYESVKAQSIIYQGHVVG